MSVFLPYLPDMQTVTLLRRTLPAVACLALPNCSTLSQKGRQKQSCAQQYGSFETETIPTSSQKSTYLRGRESTTHIHSTHTHPQYTNTSTAHTHIHSTHTHTHTHTSFYYILTTTQIYTISLTCYGHKFCHRKLSVIFKCFITHFLQLFVYWLYSFYKKHWWWSQEWPKHVAEG